MLKKILKIVYIGFSIVFGFVLFIAIYNTNAYNHIYEMTQEAVASGNYANVAKIHGGCFELTNLASDDSDNLDLAVFRSSTLEQATYYVDEENTVNYSKYVKSYYIYVLNPNFSIIDVTNGDQLLNKAGFRFTGTSGEYDYYFKVDESYNTSLYKEKPASLNEALINNGRYMTADFENWKLYQLVLTSTMIDAMNIGTINKISVCDNQGNVVGEASVTLDFTGDYFNDIQELEDAYNAYIDVVTKEDVKNDEKTEAVNAFNSFYEGENGFETRFLSNSNYSFRYEDKVLQPSSIMWTSIGLICLYIVAAALLFILCFHFHKVRRIFSKDAYKDYEGSRKKASTSKNSVEKTNKEENVVEAEIEEVDETQSVPSTDENTESQEDKAE